MQVRGLYKCARHAASSSFSLVLTLSTVWREFIAHNYYSSDGSPSTVSNAAAQYISPKMIYTGLNP